MAHIMMFYLPVATYNTITCHRKGSEVANWLLEACPRRSKSLGPGPLYGHTDGCLLDHMGVSHNLGAPFGGPHNKDYKILGSILGVSYFEKLPYLLPLVHSPRVQGVLHHGNTGSCVKNR